VALAELEQQVVTKWLCAATWDDAVHLNELERRELWSSIPEFQRDARTKGVPYLGSGLIYPFPQRELEVNDFQIPRHWPRGYGMDVGWNKTAAAFLAHDREDDVLYIYSVHCQGHVEPPSHAQAILARGKWMPGRIDPASRASGQLDGKKLYGVYQKLGLRLGLAPNAVEAGILSMYTRMATGRLKIFASCHAFWEEYGIYQRDDHGKVVKEQDHVMDASRYGVQAVEEDANWLATAPVTAKPKKVMVTQGQQGTGWLNN
jgi:hypothetical protein